MHKNWGMFGFLLSIVVLTTVVILLRKQRGRVFILYIFNFFSIFTTFLLSFLSRLILSLTLLRAREIPDFPRPKWVPISFKLNFL